MKILDMLSCEHSYILLNCFSVTYITSNMHYIIRAALICLIALSVLTTANAHTPSDTISYRQMGLGTAYRYNGKILSMRKLSNLVNKDPEAALLLQKSKTNTVIATAFSFAAGYFIGYEIGRNKSTGQPMRPAFIGAGVVMLGVAIPISSRGNKQLNRSVRIYNHKKAGAAVLQ